jgi:small-conductance mechanosensitive channel
MRQSPVTIHCFKAVIPLIVHAVFAVLPCLAQPNPNPADAETAIASAPISLDGKLLFRIRGTSSFPAEQRAQAIVGRIVQAAQNPSVQPSELRIAEKMGGLAVFAGDQPLVVITEADVAMERVPLQILAQTHRNRIAQAISEYRHDRSTVALLRSAAMALGGAVVLGFALFLVIRLFRWLIAALERRTRHFIEHERHRALKLIELDRFGASINNVLRAARFVFCLVLVLFYLNFVLELFPWTRSSANQMAGILLNPLVVMGQGLIQFLPNLAFLAVLTIVVRYILKLTKLFFGALGTQGIPITGFEPEWAAPTYRMVRFVIVAFALIVSYPYLPGSDSAAFKGVSLFLGVLFSLGSSSAIANVIAGYSLTYRRAFKVGDRVRIGDAYGDVTAMRLQVTHLRSVKNEEIIIPNSGILNSHVINYSTLVNQGGLILHTIATIGYETPWRQVKAMMLMAAERSPDCLKEPPPFINVKELGDFAVTYELNVYCDQPQRIEALYTQLHLNVLDVFNQYGVQIMTPHYEGDPAQLKLVPPDQLYVPPAVPDRESEKPIPESGIA